MNTVEVTVEIDAPVEEVFQFVSDYGNVMHFMDNVISFEPVGSATYGLGTRFRWTTQVKGFTVDNEFEVVEFEPPYSMAARSVSGAPTASRWSFAPSAGRTLATFAASYSPPRFALVRYLSDLLRLEGEVESSIANSVRNLKHIMERKAHRATSALAP